MTIAALSPLGGMLVLGIDPGRHTGLASWDVDNRRLIHVWSTTIDQAFDQVNEMALLSPQRLLVIFEDARRRSWYGRMDLMVAKYGLGVREGAGAAKRDATAWSHFLKRIDVPHVGIGPRAGGTKWSAQQFAAATGWAKQSNQHGRDAALLVTQMNASMCTALVNQWHQAKGRAAAEPAAPLKRRRARSSRAPSPTNAPPGR